MDHMVVSRMDRLVLQPSYYHLLLLVSVGNQLNFILFHRALVKETVVALMEDRVMVAMDSKG